MSVAAPVLITGGAGFIGSNLAERLAAEGENVLIYDSLARDGVKENLRRLLRLYPGRISAVMADVRDHASLSDAAAGASAVFHLAAQVAVTTSLEEPEADFEVNCRATVHLLEALRKAGRGTPLVFASTNKVYGDLGGITLNQENGAWQPNDSRLAACGVDESQPLAFGTPYGCSKGAADQYVLDYARYLGVVACTFRMSCIYGPCQMGTEEQGWVAHFLRSTLAGEEITLFGDGRQVRDVLHVRDVVDAYLAARRAMPEVAGEAFNLGGGPANSVSLIQLLCEIELLTGRTVHLRRGEWRPGDQRWYVSDITKARRLLHLGPPRKWREGLADLRAWLETADDGMTIDARAPA